MRRTTVMAAVFATAAAAAVTASSPVARAAKYPSLPAYRAVVSVTVEERFPEITGECRSVGSRSIAWTASVPRLLLVPRPRPVLFTRKHGTGRFRSFSARVVSPCPGAFATSLTGTKFRLSLSWARAGNTLTVEARTADLDEGEGGGWTHLGCTGFRQSKKLALGGAYHYTRVETALTARERRGVLAHSLVRIRRKINPDVRCPGFGGDELFKVVATLDVRLVPVR